jgi:hypothetical protein
MRQSDGLPIAALTCRVGWSADTAAAGERSVTSSTASGYLPPRLVETGWARQRTVLWMVSSFLVAAAAAATVISIFGAGDRGIALALRITARWSFLLFWLAYSGSAMAVLWGPRLNGLARRGREFGLAFASAQLVHVGVILWHGAGSGMVFFWVGVAFTCLLVLFSVPLLRDAMGLRLWRIFLAIALNYIALVFAVDFIEMPIAAGGVANYPLSYVPFAAMLFAGISLRAAAFVRRQMHVEGVSSTN